MYNSKSEPTSMHLPPTTINILAQISNRYIQGITRLSAANVVHQPTEDPVIVLYFHFSAGHLILQLLVWDRSDGRITMSFWQLALR